MLWAMGRMSAGSDAGTPSTQATRSESVIAVASSSPMPRRRGARDACDRRVPWQSGQVPSVRNFSTRFMPPFVPCLESAFFTEFTAE